MDLRYIGTRLGLLAMLTAGGVAVAAGPAQAAPCYFGGIATGYCAFQNDGDEDEDEDESGTFGTDYLDEELEWELMSDEERAEFERESEEDERLIQEIRERWGDQYK